MFSFAALLLALADLAVTVRKNDNKLGINVLKVNYDQAFFQNRRKLSLTRLLLRHASFSSLSCHLVEIVVLLSAQLVCLLLEYFS